MAQPSDNSFRIQDVKLPGMSGSQSKLPPATVQKIASLLKSCTLEGPSLTGSEDSSFVIRAVSAPTDLGPNINKRQPVRRSSTPDGDSWRSRCAKGEDLLGNFEPISASNTAGSASEQAKPKIEASAKCVGK